MISFKLFLLALFVLLVAYIYVPRRVDYGLLKGRRVLITGGGSGIGRELAHNLAKRGAKVVISGRTERTLRETASNFPNDIHVVVADVGSVEGCQKTVSDAVQILGGLDAVVSNHVSGKTAKLSEFASVEELYNSYRMTFDVNLFGMICLAKASVPHLNASTKQPQFLHVSSLSIFYGISRMSLYSGSKAAAHPAINAFRVEMPDIAWSVINVGHVTTEIANYAMPPVARESGMPPDVCAQYLVDQMILQEREVFMPATYFPFRFPGIVAFLAATFIPDVMEAISRTTYGEDFVAPMDGRSWLESKTKGK